MIATHHQPASLQIVDEGHEPARRDPDLGAQRLLA
jgi:hypothetical protein